MSKTNTYNNKTILELNRKTHELLMQFNRDKKHKKYIILVLSIVLLVGLCSVVGSRHFGILEDDISITYITTPFAQAGQKKDLISIPSGVVKANPFLPYREVESTARVKDVPQFELIPPPETLNQDSEAARVMDTIVSGILYDKFSPSAILNIEGNDYLVKKGDIVNNYKVLDIARDSVSVKLGKNTFKAGIGEILTEGSINYNDVSNLNKKFGGERR